MAVHQHATMPIVIENRKGSTDVVFIGGFDSLKKLLVSEHATERLTLSLAVEIRSVQLLLQNPNANPEDALQGAVAYGHVLCLHALLKDSRTNPNHCRVWTPLFLHRVRKNAFKPEAVRGLEVECVAMLLAHLRINPNKVCSDGYSPLHEACTPKYDDDDDARANRRAILSLLLSHEAIDVNIHTSMPYVLVDYTPLCVAVHWKNYDAVELLLKDERVSLEDAHKDVLRDIEFFGTAVDAGYFGIPSTLKINAGPQGVGCAELWRNRVSGNTAVRCAFVSFYITSY